jgi:uncharacterized membrane protein YqjE
MAEHEPPAPGVLESIRRLCATGVALLQNRVELLGVELDEQKVRFLRVLFLAAITVFLGNTALLVLTATIIVLAGDSARNPVMIGFSILYVVGAVLAGLWLRKEIRSSPPAFGETLSELKKDLDWLKRRK